MTDSGGPRPPAGWFPDPGAAGQLRWWDGTAWTQHTQPGQPPSHVPAGATFEEAVSDERGIVRWARHATWIYALCIAIGGVFAWRLLEGFRTAFDAVLSNPGQPPPTPAEMFGIDERLFSLVQLVNLVQLGAFVVLLLWVYRAATAAQRLGNPARRSPGMAVGSWFVPVVNLWWPYQSLRDLLPSGHPTRRRIFALWTVAVGGGVLTVVGIVALFTGTGPALMVAGYLAAAVALVLGRWVITDVLACHEQLVAERGAGTQGYNRPNDDVAKEKRLMAYSYTPRRCRDRPAARPRIADILREQLDGATGD